MSSTGTLDRDEQSLESAGFDNETLDHMWRVSERSQFEDYDLSIIQSDRLNVFNTLIDYGVVRKVGGVYYYLTFYKGLIDELYSLEASDTSDKEDEISYLLKKYLLNESSPYKRFEKGQSEATIQTSINSLLVEIKRKSPLPEFTYKDRFVHQKPPGLSDSIESLTDVMRSHWEILCELMINYNLTIANLRQVISTLKTKGIDIELYPLQDLEETFKHVKLRKDFDA